MVRKPKPSQIALLGTVGILAVIIIALFISAITGRAHVSIPGAAGVPTADGRIALHPEIRDFRAIGLTGKWLATLRRGEDWQLELTHPTGFGHLLRWELHADRLELDFDPPLQKDAAEIYAVARITMPELGAIYLKGSNGVHLEGFDGNRLILGIRGSNLVVGDRGHYDALDLTIAGKNLVNLDKIRIRNAEVHIAGNTRVTLSMDGGQLSGFLAGAGSLDYRGTVSSETVRVAGVARIQRLD